MRGPEILARTMSVATERGKTAGAWQYHSQSDNHSKVACWTVLFDLLVECDVLREQARRGAIAFGINHVMVGPINKTLDLVVTLVPPSRAGARRATFADLVGRYGIRLDAEERRLLNDMPVVEEDSAQDVSEVAIALEAKACMTEHIKAMPRLHAEILATGYLAKRAAPRCISVSYSLVNAAATFCSPGRSTKVNRHKQPESARRVVQMLGTALPLAREVGGFGYDVIGVTVLDCCNDGSDVVVRSDAPAPSLSDHYHYERMIRSICAEFRSRFSSRL